MNNNTQLQQRQRELLTTINKLEKEKQQLLYQQILQTKKLFKKYKLPMKKGDIEYISFCLFHKPCIFITGDNDLLNDDFIKQMLIIGIEIIMPKMFVEKEY